jgi:hypothetical protein
LDHSTLDRLADRILDGLARDEPVGPVALQFLLRRLAAGDRDDLSEPLGAALARELHHPSINVTAANAREWLVLFSDASALSDDPRLQEAAARLLPDIRQAWADPHVAVAMAAIDASLRSANVAADRLWPQAAIDALEGIIAAAYRPGLGIAHRAGGPAFIRGTLDDHVRSTAALLSAYFLAERLPYAMLADELMQAALRAPLEGDPSFATRCDQARVLSRLAALHRDEQYQRTAVLSTGVDYADSARTVLAALTPSLSPLGAAAAPFGLALAEWLDLQ